MRKIQLEQVEARDIAGRTVWLLGVGCKEFVIVAKKDQGEKNGASGEEEREHK